MSKCQYVQCLIFFDTTQHHIHIHLLSDWTVTLSVVGRSSNLDHSKIIAHQSFWFKFAATSLVVVCVSVLLLLVSHSGSNSGCTISLCYTKLSLLILNLKPKTAGRNAKLSASVCVCMNVGVIGRIAKVPKVIFFKMVYSQIQLPFGRQ